MTADVHGTAQREYLDGLHLAEVGAELGPDADLAAFTARLGTPQVDAAELRAAAGPPAAPGAAAAVPGEGRPGSRSPRCSGPHGRRRRGT